MIGRVASGYLLDRVFAPRVAMWIFGAAAFGIALLRTAAGTRLVFLAVFLIGLGMGAEVDIIAYLTSRYFGLRAFGEIYGYAFASYTVGRCTRSVAHGARVRSLRFLWLSPGGLLVGYFVGGGLDDPARSLSISSGHSKSARRPSLRSCRITALDFTAMRKTPGWSAGSYRRRRFCLAVLHPKLIANFA